MRREQRCANLRRSILDPIPLVGRDGTVGHSGDNGDLVHYRTEFTVLEFNMLVASGGLPPCVPIIWGKGALTRHSRRRLCTCGPIIDLHGNKLPNPPGVISERPEMHLDKAFSCSSLDLRVSHRCAIFFVSTV